MSVIVTTAGRTYEAFINLAKQIARELSIPYIDRQKRSVKAMQEKYGADVMVVSKERLEFYPIGATEPFFFHPNSAAFRLKRILKGEPDLFLQATDLHAGDCFLDTTAGLCSDSLIAAHAVGASGRVQACELNEIIAYIVSKGLATYETPFQELQACMRRVQLVQSDSLDFLKNAVTDSFDCVYMDPMFEEVIEESTNFQSLRQIGEHNLLTEEWVNEAKRVAKKRLVIKAHFRSELFERYGFQRYERLTAKFHYGVMEL